MKGRWARFVLALGEALGSAAWALGLRKRVALDGLRRAFPDRTEQERRVRLKAQTDHARKALALSRVRYANGIADFITTLDAQRTLLQAELQYAQSTTMVSTNLVQL